MVDRLDRLRHHAVVSSDDHHDDVGDVGAAGAHRGERGVARRVDEADRLLARVNLIRADVLGDSSCLAGDHLGRANGVEQRSLPVINVAHDRDDRGALLQVCILIFEDDLLDLLVGG